MYVLLRLVAVILLVAANAFFVAAEYALVSIRDTRIQQLIAARRIGARTVQKLHQKLDEVLNGVQLGVTMASLALGWVGEEALAHLLEQAFVRLPHSAVWAHVVGITIAFAAISYMHVILGEVVPKSLALHRVERVALAVAAPLDVFMTLFGPFLRFMAASTRIVLRWFGVHSIREGGVHSPEELKLIVTASSRTGVIPPVQEDMIVRALDLETVTVREIMVPRPDIFSLPGDMTLPEAAQRVVDEQHSRVPVFDPVSGPEHIIGVLYSKDLMRWLQRQFAKAAGTSAASDNTVRVRHIMREVLVVPETKTLPDLLVEFKKRKRHLAVVVDEFGSTAGLVTVEDVLEQLVGEIEDEFDTVAELKPATSVMVLDGATNVRDLESQYQLRLPRDEGFETLAGFILKRLQRIPKQGDHFEYENRRFTVLDMQERRIGNVKVEQLKPVPAA